MANQRGLVISNPMQIWGRSVSILSGDLDLQELRFGLLFWDILEYPISSIRGLGAEAEFLINEGIMSRTNVNVSDVSDFSGRMRQRHLRAFRMLDAKEPGCWSMAAGVQSFFDGVEREDARGALIALHQAIPVPDKEVPLQDILEFRAKRRDELLALRYDLDGVYQKVLAAGDGALALRSETERLERAITGYVRCSKESKFRFRNMSVEAELNIAGLITSSALAFTQVLTPLQAILGIAASSLSVSMGKALKGSSTAGTPYRYVAQFHDELF